MRNAKLLVCGIVLCLALPILAAVVIYFACEINVIFRENFWYGYMAYFGTILLAGVALYQNLKAHQLNANLHDLELAKSRPYFGVVIKDFLSTSEYNEYVLTSAGAFLTPDVLEYLRLPHDKSIKGVELSLHGELPAMDVRIYPSIRYLPLPGQDDKGAFVEQLETMHVPIFGVNQCYFQHILPKDGFDRTADSITIKYRTTRNEEIVFKHKIISDSIETYLTYICFTFSKAIKNKMIFSRLYHPLTAQ